MSDETLRLVTRRLDDRRALLIARLRVLEEMVAIGEGSSIGIERALLHDEMEFLADLYRRLYVQSVAEALERSGWTR